MELRFEQQCLQLVADGDWERLEAFAVEHLDKCKAKSALGFLYLGVALYKAGRYDSAVQAYQKAAELDPKNAQVQYNLGLAYFKEEAYTLAVEHLKSCIALDPAHRYAYNNLAFIYNMHQYYHETITVCRSAKLNLLRHAQKLKREKRGSQPADGGPPSEGGAAAEEGGLSHNCHRHWAFALYKKGEVAEAVKKIKKAVQLEPEDPDNWIVWGLILRSVGSYKSALHKFEHALRLDPDNSTAKYEIELLHRIMDLDSQVTLEEVAGLKRLRPVYDADGLPRGMPNEKDYS